MVLLGTFLVCITISGFIMGAAYGFGALALGSFIAGWIITIE